jgi:type IV fimbrial biogenesis protein FimT
MRTLTKNQGFTLVEMLVVAALLAVLGAMAAPVLDRAAASMRMTSAANDLVASLYLARSESIKRRSRVALCVSSDGELCAASGSWNQGWIVFHDADNDGRRGPAEAVLRRAAPMPVGWRFSGNQTVARYVSFEPGGGTRLVSGAFQAGTLTLCRESPYPADARKIIINATGRARVQRTTLEQCA